jgi:ABC-type sugar transport system ATPase subunit
MKVSQVEQLGGHALMYGTLQGGSASVTAQVAGQHAARPDDVVALYAPRAACHYFDASGLRVESAA